MIIVQWLLWIAISIGFAAIALLALEGLAACIPATRKRSDGAASRASLAVLIPAHNEEAGIHATLDSIRPQMRPGDRLIVIADNCTDLTADRARGCGVEVIERHDANRRGKGYALDFGTQTLKSSQAPDVVVLIDADCNVHPGALDALATSVTASGRPAQAIYLMETPLNPSPADRLSAFAFLFKNLVRPLGLHRLGLPCLLTGTGMAFPWAVLQDAPLASGNIVEDMQLGLDLTLAGFAPLLCPDARVTGRLPSETKAATAQRTRWEHGHLRTILTQCPKLLLCGIFGGNLSAIALAFELAIPPLSLLVAFWFAATVCVAGECVVMHAFQPLIAVGIGWLILTATILVAWARFARDLLSLPIMLSIPFYVFKKLPLYKAFLRKRETSWIRTVRDHESTPTKTTKVRIGHALIDNVNFPQALARIDEIVHAGKPGYVLTPNVDHVVQLERDELLRTIYAQADLVLADGMPVVWAGSYLGTPLKRRIAGSDLFPMLCEMASQKKYRVFFLGGRPGAGEKAIEILSVKYPGFDAQSYCPPFGFENDTTETEKIGSRIHAYSPHILCVAVGAPKQEYWIYRHGRQLGVPVSLGVGASLDFVAGYQKRAPLLFRKIGLEWFWRLIMEPRRMYRRYLIDDPVFFSIIWKQKHAPIPPSAISDRQIAPPSTTAKASGH
jgi:exopolysaccharide biosynthesis WecB/TagA/CpsF family protein